jgi:16S rRNA G966 N2-methylase RsmD
LEGALVHTLDIFSFLHRLAIPGGYDFILADPPYAKQKGERDFGVELLSDPAVARALAPGGCFVLEKLPGSPLPKGSGWEVIRERRYGATEVAFLTRSQLVLGNV